MQKDTTNMDFENGDFGVYRLINSHKIGKTQLIIICDHASNNLPQEFGLLGLEPNDLVRHIAYDLGAEPLTRLLSELLDVPAILTNFSRLLIDCNRGRDDPTLVVSISDNTLIPGNRKLTTEMRSERINRFYNPYHSVIEAILDEALTNNIIPVLLSIHTFTPVWRGLQRPWHVGVLWDKDPRLAHPLLKQLINIPELIVGDNEPYRGWLRGDSLWQHGTRRGLPHALIEIRQDELANDTAIRTWGERLSKILSFILSEEMCKNDIMTIKQYGSKTDTETLDL